MAWRSVASLLVLALSFALFPGAGGVSAASVEVPDYLNADARKEFREYIRNPQQRAYAFGRNGAWGYAYGHSATRKARNAALDYCREHAKECVVIAVNDKLIEPEHPYRSPEEPFFLLSGAYSPQAVLGFALAGIAGLIVSAWASLRAPLLLPMIWIPWPWIPKTWKRIRINYLLILLNAIALALFFPLFKLTVDRGLTDPAHFVLFAAPIVLLAVQTVYVHSQGGLGEFPDSQG
ncbi:MAG: hypothetical protein V5B78_12330 [Desulfohalobiaceae bacterium]